MRALLVVPTYFAANVWVPACPISSFRWSPSVRRLDIAPTDLGMSAHTSVAQSCRNGREYNIVLFVREKSFIPNHRRKGKFFFECLPLPAAKMFYYVYGKVEALGSAPL